MANTTNIYDGSHPEVSIPQIGSEIELLKEAVSNSGGDTPQTSCPFPVDSVLMFNTTADPNTIWAGTTWVEIGSNCYLVGAGTHTVGTSGGSNTRTITTEQIPSHSHGIEDHNHTTPNHTHPFTQPSVSGGSCTTESGGAHRHYGYYREDIAGSGEKNVLCTSTNAAAVGKTTAEITYTDEGSHTHSIPSHSHTASGGSVNSGGASSTGYAGLVSTGTSGGGQSLNIEPTYYSVAIWTRTE